jgi:hypothetical protein
MGPNSHNDRSDASIVKKSLDVAIACHVKFKRPNAPVRVPDSVDSIVKAEREFGNGGAALRQVVEQAPPRQGAAEK